MKNHKLIIVGNNYSSALIYFLLQEYHKHTRHNFDLLFLSNSGFYSINQLLPQLICDGCELNDIAQDFRKIGFISPGIDFLEAEIKGIDFDSNLVKTSCGNLKYDSLVLSLDNDNYEKNFEVKSDKFFLLNSYKDVLNIKRHIIRNMNKAKLEDNIEIKKSLLTYSVIGANERGIEIAFGLSDFVDDLLKRQFPQLNRALKRINLLESDQTIKIKKSKEYNNYLFQKLNNKFIRLFINTKVERVVNDRIQTSENKEVYSSTVVYAMGNAFSDFINELDLEKNENKLAITDLHTKAVNKENVFVVGESSHIKDLNKEIVRDIFFYKKQAEICAYNVFSSINGNSLKQFDFENKNDILAMGKADALMMTNKKLKVGYFAWLSQRLSYLNCFFGFQKKLSIFINILLTTVGLKDYVLFDLIDKKKIKEKDLVKVK